MWILIRFNYTAQPLRDYCTGDIIICFSLLANRHIQYTFGHLQHKTGWPRYTNICNAIFSQLHSIIYKFDSISNGCSSVICRQLSNKYVNIRKWIIIKLLLKSSGIHCFFFWNKRGNLKLHSIYLLKLCINQMIGVLFFLNFVITKVIAFFSHFFKQWKLIENNFHLKGIRLM